MFERAVKALARLCVCADASEHWMNKYSISVKSLISHTKQLFSFENSGCSLISNHSSAQSNLGYCYFAHTAYEHDSMHAKSTTKPFQSNLSKTLLYDNCPKLYD